MQIDQATGLLVDALAVRPGCTDRSVIDTALVAVSRLIGVLESQRIVCATALRHMSAVPQIDLADVSVIDRRQAASTFDRAELAGNVPEFADALAEGAVSAGHLDRLNGALRRLEPANRKRLVDRAEELADIARQTSPEDFATRLRQVEREIHADDGETRLARQKSDVRLRSWIGPDDGMHYWKLALDPETAVSFSSRVRAATESLFHGGDIPEDAPLDWRERESFIGAHALLALIDPEVVRGQGVDGQGVDGQRAAVGYGRPEYIIVEDRRGPNGPRVDLGLPIDLPAKTVAAMRARARQVTVVVEADRVVSAPGTMNLGRTARVASIAQRRALRALYATCAVPGCAVGFDDCTIHHVVWWRLGGQTDLDNLLPVCWRHHHHVHDDGWITTTRPGQYPTFTLPNGTVVEALPNRYATATSRGP